jgi:hypothetical protein
VADAEFLPAEKTVIARLSERDRLDRIGGFGGFSPRQANAILKAKVANVIADGVAEMGAEVQGWIRDVAKTNPAQAVELFMQYAEFVQPRLKAATVIGHANLIPPEPGTRSIADLTIEELEAMGNGG